MIIYIELPKMEILDDNIDEENTFLKKLEELEKKQYENYIIEYMEENNNSEITIADGKLKKTLQKSNNIVVR